MRMRTIAALAAVTAAIVAGVLPGASPVPAGAQNGFSPPTPVVGDFAGDAREELFLYGFGTEGDYLVSFDATGGVSYTSNRFRVDGFYQPVAGNFDGDPQDELLWYGFGADPDYLWNFTGFGSASSSRISVGGFYQAVAGDFTGDGTDDVIWYGSGTGPDYVWDFAATGAFVSSALAINGFYQPVAGSFGVNDTDDVVWYGIGVDPDYLWDFRVGDPPGADSRPLAVNGFYDPFELDAYDQGAGGGDIFWYGFSTAPDYFWDFQGGALARTFPDPVNGNYFPKAAGDLFGDGSDDVLWFTEDFTGNGPVNVWDHTLDGAGNLVRTRYALPPQFWVSSSGAAVQQSAPAAVSGG